MSSGLLQVVSRGPAILHSLRRYPFLPILLLIEQKDTQVSFHASLRREVDRAGLGSAMKHKVSVFIQNLRTYSICTLTLQWRGHQKQWLGPSRLHHSPWVQGFRDVTGDAAWRLSVPTLDHQMLIGSGCISNRAGGGRMGTLVASRLRHPQSNVTHLTTVLPSDHASHPPCPNLAMFSKLRTATVKITREHINVTQISEMR